MPARHISEGELLLTHGQMAAVKGTRSVQHTLTQPEWSKTSLST